MSAEDGTAGDAPLHRHETVSNDRSTLTSAETILALFEQGGFRTTRPRRIIAARLAAMAAAGQDFATQDLWKELQEVDAGIGRATVYRAVDLLLREGLLDRVPFADGTHRYRLCGANHHHHVTCVQCQRVVEVDMCLSAAVLEAVANSTNFTIEGHALELFVRCGQCRERRPAERGDARAYVPDAEMMTQQARAKV